MINYKKSYLSILIIMNKLKLNQLLLVFAAILLIISSACESNKNKISPLQVEKAVYQKAIKANDAVTALGAAYRIVLIEPEEKNYNDSIAHLLFVMENYRGAIEVAENILADHNNKNLFGILAKSNFELQNYTDASMYYQDLMRADSVNKVEYLYDIGTCFYYMENNETAFKYMSKVMEEDQSRMKKKRFITNKQAEETYYYVAAMNFMGIIYIGDRKYAKAEEIYQELFKIDDKFQLAKNNYSVLQQLKEDEALDE